MKTITATLTVLLFVLTVLVGACNGDDGSDESPTPSLTDSTTPTPTAEPSVTVLIEDDIGAAYLEYWDVYSDAVFNLDESRLEDVMTGPQLERTLDEIESLRQQGRAAKIDVEHDFVVLEVDELVGTAVVRDEYTNRSAFVDAKTKELIGQPASGEMIKDTFTLVRVDETWKVQDSVRDVQ